MSLAARAASSRYGGRHHSGIPGGFIPFYPGGFVVIGIDACWRNSIAPARSTGRDISLVELAGLSANLTPGAESSEAAAATLRRLDLEPLR